MKVIPKHPKHLHPLALETLEELCRHQGSENIIIGGGVALQHYCEFRKTADLDCWWAIDANEQSRIALESTMHKVAQRNSSKLQVRAWGRTESYELVKDDRKVFSLQISVRSVELEKALNSSWHPIKLEDFRDTVGEKMNALVNRGAPRDFLDVYEICRRNLARVNQLWQAWSDKNSGKDPKTAIILVLHHLEAIELRRPLSNISKESERQSAKQVRFWIKNSLCSQT